MSKLFRSGGFTDLAASSKAASTATSAKPGFFSKIFGKSDPSLKYKVSDIAVKPNKITKPQPKIDIVKNKFKDINSTQNLDELTNQYKLFKKSLQDLDVPEQNQLSGLNDQFETRFKTLKFNKKVDDFYKNVNIDIDKLKKNLYNLDTIGTIKTIDVKNQIKELKIKKETEFKNIIDDPNKPTLIKLDKKRFDKMFDDLETDVLYRIESNFRYNMSFRLSMTDRMMKTYDKNPEIFENFKKFKKEVDDYFKTNIKGQMKYYKKPINQLRDTMNSYEKKLNKLDKQFKKSLATKEKIKIKTNNSPYGTPEEKKVIEQLNDGETPELTKNQIDDTKNKLATENDPKKAYSKLKTLSLVSGGAAVAIGAYIIYSQSKAEVQSSTDYKIISITKETDNSTLINFEPADTFINGLNIQILETNSYPAVNGFYKIKNAKPGTVSIDASIIDSGNKGIIKYLTDFNQEFNDQLTKARELIEAENNNKEFLADTDEIPTIDDSNKIFGINKILFIIIVIVLILAVLLSIGFGFYSM